MAKLVKDVLRVSEPCYYIVALGLFVFQLGAKHASAAKLEGNTILGIVTSIAYIWCRLVGAI